MNLMILSTIGSFNLSQDGRGCVLGGFSTCSSSVSSAPSEALSSTKTPYLSMHFSKCMSFVWSDIIVLFTDSWHLAILVSIHPIVEFNLFLIISSFFLGFLHSGFFPSVVVVVVVSPS